MWKYQENISKLKHIPSQPQESVQPQFLFGSLRWSLSHLYVAHYGTISAYGAVVWQTASPKKEIRLLSSFDYNHDLSGALLFCIKLNFMITLIALFMSCFCHYAPSNCLALLFQRLTSYSDVTKPKSSFISYFMFTAGLRRYFRVRDEPNRISVT